MKNKEQFEENIELIKKKYVEDDIEIEGIFLLLSKESKKEGYGNVGAYYLINPGDYSMNKLEAFQLILNNIIESLKKGEN